MKLSKSYKEFFYAKSEIKEGELLDAVKIYDEIINRNTQYIQELTRIEFIPIMSTAGLDSTKQKEVIQSEKQIISNNFQTFLSEYLELVTAYLDIKIDETNPIFAKFNNAKISIQKKSELNISDFKKKGTLDFWQGDNPATLTNEEENISKLRLYNFSDKVHWGKFAGNTIEEIFNTNPKYILRCITNLEHFVIKPFIFLFDNIKLEPLYFEALEINLIKILVLNKWPQIEDKNHDYEPQRYSDYDTFKDAFDGDIDAWRQFND